MISRTNNLIDNSVDHSIDLSMSNSICNQDYLGSGMKFPPQINHNSGRFVISSNMPSVKESIYIILMTKKGERFTRPNFGSKILSYTFMDFSITRLNMLSRELKETILEQEPRIEEVNIDIEPKQEAGCFIINITYYVGESNKSDNLVFPFYINEQLGDNVNEAF